MLAFVVMVIVILGKMCINVLPNTHRERREILSTLLLPIILVSILVIVRLSNLNTLLYGEHFYVFFYTIACFWARNEIYMQICSVTNQNFNALNWSTITFVASFLLLIIFPSIQSNIGLYLGLILGIQLFFLIELIISFLNQAANILQIKLFKVNIIP